MALRITTAACLTGLVAAGCSGTTSVAKLELPAIAASGPHVSGPPIDVYSGVARAALQCWFGAEGPLKATHIFHADAPTADGGAEIVLHERDPTQQNPRGKRVYRVTFAPVSGGSTLVAPEAMKLASEVAANMDRDVLRWARGVDGCTIAEVMAAPVPKPEPPRRRRPRARPG